MVDDDPVLRTMLSIALREAGHEVFEAEDGTCALDRLRLLKSEGRLPEVIVTDIQMPRIGGVELLEQLSLEGIPIPTIAMTAVGDRDLVVRLLRAGAEEFLDKPFDYHEMRLRIEAILRRSRARKGGSGLEIEFEGQSVRLDKSPDEARRVLERMRTRVDTIEAMDKGRIQLPRSLPELSACWKSRQTRELGGQMVAHSSTPDRCSILVAHSIGNDALAVQTSSMIRLLFSVSHPTDSTGEDFLRAVAGVLFVQPKQPLVRALHLRFDFGADTLEIASAGHPSPLVVPKRGTPYQILPDIGGELGPNPAPRLTSAAMPFGPFDRLVVPCPWLPLLSQIHTPTGAALHLGLQGVAELIPPSRHPPLEAMVDAIWEGALEFARWNTSQDLLLLGFERNRKPDPGSDAGANPVRI